METAATRADAFPVSRAVGHRSGVRTKRARRGLRRHNIVCARNVHRNRSWRHRCTRFSRGANLGKDRVCALFRFPCARSALCCSCDNPRAARPAARNDNRIAEGDSQITYRGACIIYLALKTTEGKRRAATSRCALCARLMRVRECEARRSSARVSVFSPRDGAAWRAATVRVRYAGIARPLPDGRSWVPEPPTVVISHLADGGTGRIASELSRSCAAARRYWVVSGSGNFGIAISAASLIAFMWPDATDHTRSRSTPQYTCTIMCRICTMLPHGKSGASVRP